MSRRYEDDYDPPVPFPVWAISNGEWLPAPVSEKQRLAVKLIAEETGARARRHGMTRKEFMRTAAATATAFAVLNKIHGLDAWGDNAVLPVKKVHCDDLDAGSELLDRKMFVMDVQTHHVDLGLRVPPSIFCFLRFGPGREMDALTGLQCPESLGRINYMKELFLDSQTSIGVISGLPGGLPLGPRAGAETRDMVNEAAGTQRCLMQMMVDPTVAPGAQTSIANMENQVVNLKALKVIKTYTYNGNWFLDDETVAYPMFQEATRLGVNLINVHKGLPATFAPGSEQTVRTIDFPKAVRDWPDLNFCAYHSGWFEQAGDGTSTHPEGKNDITEFLEVVSSMPKKERQRVYAEIGSTFAIALSQGPETAAHLIGRLLKTLGPRNILWGSDSIWWGSPQFLIDAFKDLQIPEAMRKQFGYPKLTEKVKKRILGLNAANLYGLKKPDRTNLCAITPDRFEQIKAAQGGFRAARSLRTYGPLTRREVLAMAFRDGRIPSPNV